MLKKISIIYFILINFLLISQNKKYIIPSNDIDKWYSTGVFYELFIRSFYDSNGDRYGDIRGVIEKLDYLKSLGISGIWFMPIHPASDRSNGHGYDVTDHFSINQDYGTMDDFKELLEKAHKLNIKIIIDFVVNHVSSEHPFFVDALNNKDSKYKDWFIFADNKPEGKYKGHWCPDNRKNPTKWYYGYFGDKMPDLNYKNKDVLNYMLSVIKYWLDIGVDGFRFDAVTHIVENGPENTDNQPETFEILKQFRKFIDENYKDRDIFLVAEASSNQADYLGNGKDLFHSVFNFKINNTILRTVKNLSPYTSNGVNMIESIVSNYVKELKDKNGAFWATLLSNHDEYVGKRAFAQLEQNIDKAKLAGSIYLTLPGIPFVYYGEEIATDTTTKFKGDRFLRCCMQWDDSNINAGFTKAEKAWNIVNENYTEYNVAKFDKDPNSILNLYRNIIKIRNENKALSLGSFQALIPIKNDTVSAFLREYLDNKIIVILSFYNSDININFDLINTNIVSYKGKINQLLGKQGNFKIKGNVLSGRIAKFDTVILKLE